METLLKKGQNNNSEQFQPPCMTWQRETGRRAPPSAQWPDVRINKINYHVNFTTCCDACYDELRIVIQAGNNRGK